MTGTPYPTKKLWDTPKQIDLNRCTFWVSRCLFVVSRWPKPLFWYRDLLFGIEILHSVVQHLDRLLPGINPCVFLWPRHSVHWRSKGSRCRKEDRQISILNKGISIPSKRVTRSKPGITGRPIFIWCGCWGSCPLPMRMPNPNPILNKNLAPMGPESLSSTSAGVWRKAPGALTDSSSALDTFQSATHGLFPLSGPCLGCPEVLWKKAP